MQNPPTSYHTDILPTAQVDENMQSAHARDAVKTQKFWFRRNVLGKLIALLFVHDILN